MAAQTPHHQQQQQALASPALPQTNASELSFFWAAAIILQYLSQLDWISRLYREPLSPASIAQTAAVLLATLTVVRPSDVRAFICMAAAQVCAGWINLPEIPNHRLLTTLFDLTLLSSAAALSISRQPISTASIWSVARPFTQRLLCTLYLFAAFAKLNSTYLLSVQSCGVQLYYEIGDHIPLPQYPLAALLSAWIGIAVEFTLPIALLFSRHRHKAILVGLMFHFALAIDSARHFSDFSAVSFAALLTFAAGPVLPSWTRKLLTQVLLWGCILCLLTGVAAVRTSGYISLFFVARDLMWLSYATLVMSAFILSRLFVHEPTPPHPKSGLFPILRGIIAIPLALALLNGLSPYLGFKTRSGWDMYSNLQLAGTNPNHTIIPRSLDLLGELSTPIAIISSTNSLLQQRYQQDKYDITPFELRKVFADDPSGTTTFKKGERLYENFKHDSAMTPFSTPPSALWRKLLWFRQIDQNPDPRCQW